MQNNPQLSSAMMKMMGGGGGGGGQEQTRTQSAASGIGQGLSDAGDALMQQRQTQPIGAGNDILKMLAQLGLLEQRQSGGEVAPGQAVTVGEAGPEVMQAGPGGAQVTPLPGQGQPMRTPAPYEAEGFDLKDHLQSALVGLLGGQEALDARRAGNAAQQKFLATAGIQHPMILTSSPEVARAVDEMIGPGGAQALLNEYDPNYQARAMSQLYNIRLAPPGSVMPDGTPAPGELAQFQQEIARRGYGLTYTSKGEMRVTQQARSPESRDALAAYNIWDTVRQNLVAGGMGEGAANVAAAKRALEIGAQRGITVPEPLNKLALAGTETAIQAARAGAEADARNQSELRFAAPIAGARETGTRAARLNMPIGEDEIRARDVTTARQQGGVVFGRDLKDDDLLSAESSKLLFKLTPEGNYIGIPKDVVAKDDPGYLSPRELLSKRIAQKMADKRTTQNENAQIVIGALDDIDNLHALSLLPNASAPTGPGLAGMVGGAIKTELETQTKGRMTVWAARRSPDPEVREKAIALINLGTLSTSLVKALGDVGAISEADKFTFNQRVGRIVSGNSSQEEAATMLQQIRGLMMRAAAGPLRPEDTHQILHSPPNPVAPPPGFTPFGPGYYRVTP